MINKRFFKTKEEVEVTFEVTEQQLGDVDQVTLVADFSDWQPIEMKKVAKTKSYKIKQRLPKNEQFQFRYLVNNEVWVNDEAADQYIANQYGSDNSVVSTQA